MSMCQDKFLFFTLGDFWKEDGGAGVYTWTNAAGIRNGIFHLNEHI